MKLNLISLGLFLLIFINLSSCNHSKVDYKSSALDAYNDSVSKSWKLEKLNGKKPLEIQNDFLNIISVKNPAILNRDFRRDFEDSLIKARRIDLSNSKEMEKLWNEVHKDKIGPIDKYDAIKYGNLKDNQAVIYTDNKFNGCFEDGYWIALSNDNGKNWKRYYTGLIVNKNYYFKSNSKIPLWKNSNTIHVEAAKVKKISDRVIMLSPEKFAMVKDSIAIELNIVKITKDSDSDGLTDIVEDIMLLNPNNPDTDGDRISDAKDKNPRFKSKKTAKSILYEVLMESHLYFDTDSYQINFSNLPKIKNNIFNKERKNLISIFVTDDKEVLGLELKNETLIIMSSKEYEKYKLKYPFSFSKRDYSKMFLCDGENSVYIIQKFSCSSGTNYLIKKNDTGWEVSFFGGYTI
jgi:hypothetical protein